MLRLLGEPQALVPGDRIGGVCNAQDRDDLFVHAGMVPRERAGRGKADGPFEGLGRAVLRPGRPAPRTCALKGGLGDD